MSETNNPTATNIQKHENYREQFVRLKKLLCPNFTSKRYSLNIP